MAHLDPGLRDRLAAISRGQGPLPPDAYFKSHHKPRLLAALGVASLGAALFMAFLAVQTQARGGLADHPGEFAWQALAAAVFVAYGTVCLAALRRTARSAMRPFVLVTPAAILRVGLAHDVLEGLRLRDATKFEKVAEYSRGQNYSGTAYHFVFPEGRFTLKEKSAAQIQRLDAVLARARAGGARTDDPLLPPGGQPQAPRFALLLDPFSTFWVQSWIVIALIICVTVIVLASQ